MKLHTILTSLINVLVGIIELLLSVRLLLRLLGANPNTPFVAWVYDTSNALITPFKNIFPPFAINESMVLEFSTIFAIVVYMLIGWIIVALLDSLFDSYRTSKINR